ncbi:glutathione synthase/RimK-type ligase-like ATP-grasp enzyme [Cellulosimicrobium cellulans J34]|nr:glutathione synthase/RimK-type ligase-like ATP-grasp enzyme [Cellulosimicrobium cellulans J34]SMF02761.1 Glutathione synthase/RimK-type ligase, ATP-grasp superfamily [Cellulosimicrobium cellulans J1]
MIGIVSHADDLHTTEVVRHLDALGASHVLLDTGHAPRSVALTSTQDAGGWHADWVDTSPDGVAAVDATSLRAVWWRRPQPFAVHDDVRSPQDRGFAVGEIAAAVAGLWSCLPATWVNDPDRDEAGSRKMWQLQVAARLGLRVPRTCMTNDPARAREFLHREPGRVIFKPFGGTPATWRETRPVREADLDLLESVRYAPVIFQEAVAGSDVRVTIVGTQVFAAELRTEESGYAYDFRVDTHHCPTAAHDLPAPVSAGLLRLMEVLGLWYGAVDLRRTPEGDYAFLEINPAGQWLFVEYATGQPIAAALAALLARLDREEDAGTTRRRAWRAGTG